MAGESRTVFPARHNVGVSAAPVNDLGGQAPFGPAREHTEPSGVIPLVLTRPSAAWTFTPSHASGITRVPSRRSDVMKWLMF